MVVSLDTLRIFESDVDLGVLCEQEEKIITILRMLINERLAFILKSTYGKATNTYSTGDDDDDDDEEIVTFSPTLAVEPELIAFIISLFFSTSVNDAIWRLPGNWFDLPVLMVGAGGMANDSYVWIFGDEEILKFTSLKFSSSRAVNSE